MKTFLPLPKIIDGISLKLNEEFGDEYKIYPEEVKQGLNRPCFFIKLLSSDNTKVVGDTYHRTNPYCVHFYPDITNEAKTVCQEMLERLYQALEYITVDGNLVRGVNMSGEIHDEILLFYVSYNVFVRRTYEQEKMETLEIELGTKG